MSINSVFSVDMLLKLLLFSFLLFGEACKTIINHDRIASAIIQNIPPQLKKDPVPKDTPKELQQITAVTKQKTNLIYI